jgi:histidyl-tRNA synthetase
VARAQIEPRTLRGFADTFPAQAIHRRRLVAAIEDTFSSFGYDPIQTPALEYAEILRGKGGDESDKQMFEFDDQGGRRVAMRFDLTVPLARFVAGNQGRLTFPFRGYNVGYVWRGEKPQRGRYREFLQCDADIVGDTGTTADAEILCMIQAALAAMDVGPVTIRVNDRRVLNGLLADLDLTDRGPAVLRALDKREKVGEEAVRAELAGTGVTGEAADRVLAMAGARQEQNADTLAAVGEIAGGGVEGKAGHRALAELLDVLEASGADMTAIRLDPAIARGLDYYTGMVYETTLLSAPKIGSISSGGRYDDLAGLFTSARLPGVGGSIGVSRILAALDDTDRLAAHGRPRPLVVLTQGDETERTALVRLADRLRHTGRFDVEVYPTPRKHAAQMKYADARGAAYVLTLDGADQVSAKDMRSGDRTSHTLAAVVEQLGVSVPGDGEPGDGEPGTLGQPR